MHKFKVILNETLANPILQILIFVLTVINFMSFSLWLKMFIVVGSFVFFLIVFFMEMRKYKKLHKDTVHIPIVLNFEPSKKMELNNILKKISEKIKDEITLEDIKKYLFIMEEELIFNYEGSVTEKEKIKRFFMFLNHDLSQLRKKLPDINKIHFHVCVIGKAGYGFLAGVVFSDKNFTFYQYDVTNDDYSIIIELKDRKIYEKKELECAQKEEHISSDGKELNVLLNFTSKSVTENMENYIKLTSQKENLESSEEFIECAREIYTVLNNLQKKDKKIYLYYAIPLGLAFLLGFLMKNYWDVELMQFVNGEYIDYINLKELDF